MQQLENNLPTKATDVAAIVASEVQGSLDLIDTIAKTPAITSMDFEEQLPILQSEARRLNFKKLGVASMDGVLRCSNNASTNISNHDYFQLASKGKVNTTNPIKSDADNAILLPVAAPIRDEYGTPVGVLIGYYDAKIISEITNPVSYGGLGYAFIFR